MTKVYCDCKHCRNNEKGICVAFEISLVNGDVDADALPCCESMHRKD